MRLIEFTDEHGNVAYKTPDGTLVPMEYVLRWKKMLEETTKLETDVREFGEYLKLLRKDNGTNR